MKRKNAVTSFFIVYVILAFLLLSKTITSTVGGFLFAFALVIFGGLSRGFRGKEASSKTPKEDDAQPGKGKNS